MFNNHLKIAWRSLKSQSFFTFLNTFGLAIGIAGGLLIALYIVDEFSFDKMFDDSDRIYRIDMDMKFGGREIESAQTAAPMATALKNDFSQIEQTVRFRTQGSILVRSSEDKDFTKESQATYVDSSFFDMFDIDLLAGDPETALSKPNSVVLTHSASERLFGEQNPIGQRLETNSPETYTVTGVVEDFPDNSFLRDYTVLKAMTGYADSRVENWGNMNYYTFVKFIPGINADEFKDPLQGMVSRYTLPWAQQYFPGITAKTFEASGNYIRYFTMPLKRIHLYSARESEMSANGSIQNIYILFFIGVFLIVLACVNFMNLSTAQSLKRAKEVGIRKTLGSKKWDLMTQFLTESGLISIFSMAMALLIAGIALPFFNTLADKSISLPIDNAVFWLIIVIAAILLGLLSGSYPAFFMTRFNPINTLKGGGSETARGGNVRSSLVVAQFAISVLLLASTLIVYQQLNYLLNKDLGYDKDQILIINDTYAAGARVDAFKKEVSRLSQVKSTSYSSYLPVPSIRSSNSFFIEGSYDQEDAIQMNEFNVDEGYIPTLDIKLVAGRNFDKDRKADSSAVIINEATLKKLGVHPDDAIGKRIYLDITESDPVFYTIIGVIKDFNFQSLRENIEAMGLFFRKSTGALMVKLNKGDFKNTIASIETIWNGMAPVQPFTYRFMDDAYNSTYKAEQKLGKIFMVFTVLSILIACLGLFGLAAFNAEKRTKEVGIRKVLGASVSQVAIRLIVDFLKLVGIGTIVALPLGWYAMNKWLEDFAYRIDISWWILVVSALIAIGIAILTVSYQSIRAAVANPVNALRSE